MGRKGQASDRHSETIILYLFKQLCHLGLRGNGVGPRMEGTLGVASSAAGSHLNISLH